MEITKWHFEIEAWVEEARLKARIKPTFLSKVNEPHSKGFVEREFQALIYEGKDAADLLNLLLAYVAHAGQVGRIQQ